MRIPQDARIELLQLLEFAEIELEDLRTYESLKWVTYHENRTARREVERLVENIINALAEMAAILLKAAGEKVPGSETARIEATAAFHFTDEQTVADLGDVARTRQALAQRFLDTKWQEIRAFLDRGAQAAARWCAGLEEAIRSQAGNDASDSARD